MTSRRSHLTLVALILAAIGGVVLLALPGSPFHRTLREGLDLQGGVEVVLKAAPTKGQVLTSDDMTRSIDVIRQRIDKLGVSEPVVTKQGTNEIDIELPAVHDVNQAAAIIGSTAKLELYDLETALVPPSIDASETPVPQTSLFNLLASVQSGQKGTPSAYYLFRKKTKQLISPKPGEPLIESRAALLRPGGGKLPKGDIVMTVPAQRVVITCDSTTSVVCPGLNSNPVVGTTYYYLLKHGTKANGDVPAAPAMTGTDLKLSGTQADFDPSTGQPIVTMQFTSKGNKAFNDITREEAQRGQALGVAQHFAIVLDNELRSFPQIDYTQYPDGIDPAGGGAEITGLASATEAKNLALVLQTGALPVAFQTVEQTDVSATLGKDSLREARNAAIAGLIVVALFLLLLYRFLGLIAVIGLVIYSVLMYGAILLLGVTLTLPGFAGLILTIGVAADANVVIFERIKEEAREGKSVRAAIAVGYAKGFHTIVDANVVTAITALILFAVATAEVKGFALMLLLGTVVSLITAVAATRAMLGLVGSFRWFQNPRWTGATSSGIANWMRIDIVGRRRLWLAISIGAIVLSVVAIAVKGLNLGIDFKGGVQITFSTSKPTSLGTVRKEVQLVGGNSAVVQGRGKQTGAQSYENFQIRVKKLTSVQEAALRTDLTSKLHAESLGIKNVSASFSRQILRSAITAIIVSFALIAFYVTVRYRWRFAVPILRTLLNDIPIALGVYAISGRQVTADTVAAILTILGYSVYDTIIVFDRIRENMKLMPRASIATIANVSVWEVLRRSIVTSVITLLPIVALFIFGGATLRDFAFAIMVGISIGAVSTIFVATPLLTQLMERDPEYARRKDEPMDETSRRRLLRRGERLAADAPAPMTPMDEVEHGIVAVEKEIATLIDGDAEAKRERRRQRRQARPHGRPR